MLLKTGVTLIATTQQLEYEPKVLLICPHQIGGKTKVTLSPWPEHCVDEHILLHSDSLLTMGEPSEKVKEAYIKKVGKRVEELTKPSEPVMLNETVEDQDDDYEPRYVEEPLY